MKSRTFVPYVLGLAVLSAISVSSLMASAQSAPADNGAPAAQMQDAGGQNQGGPGENQRPPRLQGVTRTVTNIDNGVIVTCTTSNAADVATLQSHTPPTPPADSKVTVVKENIANGIKVTITSTDSETVKRIQEHEAQGGGPRGMQGRNGSQNGSENGESDRPELKDVKRVVTNTADGVNISISSTDPETVKLIQQHEAQMSQEQGQGRQRGPRMGRGMGMGQRGQGQFGPRGGQQGGAQNNGNQAPLAQ